MSRHSSSRRAADRAQVGHSRGRRLPGAARASGLQRSGFVAERSCRRRRDQPVGAPRPGRAGVRASPATPTSCRPGPLEQWTSRSVRADATRRPAVRPRRCRHEVLDRRLRRRRRGVRRATGPHHAGSIALSCSPPTRKVRRSTARCASSRRLQRARRDPRLLHRRRADIGRDGSATRSRTAGAARSPAG